MKMQKSIMFLKKKKNENENKYVKDNFFFVKLEIIVTIQGKIVVLRIAYVI